MSCQGLTGLLAEAVDDLERTGGAPVDYHAKRDGLFIGRHFPGLIALGDPVGVIGVPA